MTTSRLYYEAHITVDSKDDSKWNQFVGLLPKKFRCSKFDEDMVDHYNGKWFTSARNTRLEDIKADIKKAIAVLKSNDYNVIRWKIEDTILDSKFDKEEQL